MINSGYSAIGVYIHSLNMFEYIWMACNHWQYVISYNHLDNIRVNIQYLDVRIYNCLNIF